MENHWTRFGPNHNLAHLQYLHMNGGTGGHYDIAEDLSGSSYLSSASKPVLNNEEASQNGTYFHEQRQEANALPATNPSQISAAEKQDFEVPRDPSCEPKPAKPM